MTKIKLIFGVFGELLEPKTFSEVSKLSPTSYWFKGDTIPNNKRGVTRQETCWEYSLGFIQTLNFDDIANLFIEKINPHFEDVIKYIESNKLETKIDIVIEIIKNEKPSLSFKKEFMSLLSKMNSEVDIDIYCLEGDF